MLKIYYLKSVKKLNKIKIKAKKQFGQHFLNSKNIAEEIVKAISISSNDIIVEVGVGTGFLTEIILSKNPSYIYGVEIDKSVYNLIEEKFKDYKNFNLIKSDFLKVNLYDLSKESKIKLVGNLPYNVASLIIVNCAFYIDILERCVFMIQKEVAEKLIAKPKTKDYTFLSVFTQTFFNVDYIMSVPGRFFTPPPKVTSAVVKLIPKDNPPIKDIKKYKNFVSHIFQNRRKMLRTKIDEEILKQADINPMARAEELNVDNFIKLFEVINNGNR